MLDGVEPRANSINVGEQRSAALIARIRSIIDEGNLVDPANGILEGICEDVKMIADGYQNDIYDILEDYQ